MKTRIYKEFDSINDDTDNEWYWISVKCSNCLKNDQIAIKQGIRVNKSRLKLLKCPKCKIKNSLSQAEWDGRKYVIC